MKGFMTLAVTLVILGATARDTQAAFTIDGVGYTASGASESLTAAFTTPDAAVSSNSYSGYVEVVVSGVGFSYGPALNDAFYNFTDQGGTPGSPTNNAAGFFQLGFDTHPLTQTALERDAIRFLAYDVLAGMQVGPGYVPAYRSDHSYDFVIRVDSAIPARLHFGVVDSLFSDNGGSYALTVTQLSSVPEPSSLGLMGVGLVAATLLARRRSA